MGCIYLEGLELSGMYSADHLADEDDCNTACPIHFSVQDERILCVHLSKPKYILKKDHVKPRSEGPLA